MARRPGRNSAPILQVRTAGRRRARLRGGQLAVVVADATGTQSTCKIVGVLVMKLIRKRDRPKRGSHRSKPISTGQFPNDVADPTAKPIPTRERTQRVAVRGD